MNKRSKVFGLATLVLCIVIGVQSGWAQEQSLAGLVDNLRACGASSEAVNRVLSSVTSGELAAEDGQKLLRPLLAVCESKFPLAPFEDKLEEGLSKRVAPPLIVRALSRKLDEYNFARSLLDSRTGAVDPQLLLAMGEGLSKGMPQADLEAYVTDFSTQPRELFLIGVEMIALLGQAGFDYDLTRSVLEAGFASKSLTPEWRFFIRLVLVARQRGLTDEAIAKAATEVLAADGSLRDVSTRLGFTSRNLTGRAVAK